MEGSSLVGVEPPPTPERTAHEFARALLGANATAAGAYFSPAGLLLTADGTEVSGRAAITAVLDQIIESDHSLEIKLGRVLRVEGLALATQFWRRTSRLHGVEPFEHSTAATLLMRLAAGDRWEILAASPWGR